MASNVVRRPLPALIALIALLLLTGLVWWRVLNRNSAEQPQAKTCSTSAPASTGPSPTTLPKPSTVDVEVLNSTSRQGIAGDARSALIAAGFTSSRDAADFGGKTKIRGVGLIRYGAVSTSAATLVGYYLPGAKLVKTPSKRSRVIVILGPQYTRVAPGAKVRAALASSNATVSGAPSPTRTTTC